MADSFGAKGAGAWDYALRIYAQEGVAPACLLLQDCVGVDVTVLLHAMYHAANSSAVGGNEVAAMDAAVSAWRREVVEPLRAVRRALKHGVGQARPDSAQDLRKAVQSTELMAERIAFALLADVGGLHAGVSQASEIDTVSLVAHWYSQANGTGANLDDPAVLDALRRLNGS